MEQNLKRQREDDFDESNELDQNIPTEADCPINFSDCVTTQDKFDLIMREIQKDNKKMCLMKQMILAKLQEQL